MRLGKTKRTKSIIRGVLVIAIAAFCLAAIQLLENPTSSSRLVSIQEFSSVGDICLPESEAANLNLADASSDGNLYAAFHETSAYAQGGAQVTEMTRRPPVRTIRDLDPIYSYVAVNTRRNEVFMQDHNMWSIRVFNRLDNTPPNVV